MEVKWRKWRNVECSDEVECVEAEGENGEMWSVWCVVLGPGGVVMHRTDGRKVIKVKKK